MSEPITQHESIRRHAAEFFGETLTDAQAEHIAATMPIAAHLMVSGALGVDSFLRNLSDNLLSLLDYLARESLLVDERNPVTWDNEWLFLVTRLLMDENGDHVTYEEIGLAAITFRFLIAVELRRRCGAYQ